MSLSSPGVGVGLGWALTSADALLLPRQDSRAVDDADALQDLIGQLGAHESAVPSRPPNGPFTRVGGGDSRLICLTMAYRSRYCLWLSLIF